MKREIEAKVCLGNVKLFDHRGHGDAEVLTDKVKAGIADHRAYEYAFLPVLVFRRDLGGIGLDVGRGRIGLEKVDNGVSHLATCGWRRGRAVRI